MSDDKVVYYKGTAPVRGYDDDAGLDLTALHTTSIPPWQMAWIDLDCRISLPHGYWTMLVGRSSMIRRRNIWIKDGVIDPGYTGPLLAGCLNIGQERATIQAGERIAQLLIFKNHTAEVEIVEGELRRTARGANGFGSTGQ